MKGAFRELKDVVKHEFQPEEPQNLEFQLKEEESNSTTQQELEQEDSHVLEDQFEREGSHKFIVYLLSIQNFLYLLLMMILELSRR